MGEKKHESGEYIAYIANLLEGTNRSELFYYDGLETDNLDPEEVAGKLCKGNERLVSVEKLRLREYVAMVRVTKLYRALFKSDCYDTAVLDIKYLANEGSYGKWEDRHHDETEIVSLEERED